MIGRRMWLSLINSRCWRQTGPFLLAGLLWPGILAAQLAVVNTSNITLRIMAGNLTGNSQTYDAAGIRLFQGLQPDIVAIQEFKYLSNSDADIRAFVNTAFGTIFQYFRETGYAIPNGIISRYPMRQAGSWDDVEIPDRGFAWAQIDVPGPVDLYVVSVHLKASSDSSSRRATEATNLKTLIQANFPANAWIVVAGDCNTDSRSEACLSTFKTFLSDANIPDDGTASANENTNNGRNKPYDYVLPSHTLATNLVPVLIGARSYADGLVFDSRVYSPLGAVSPILSTDVSALQHMPVLKDFRISFPVTNTVTLPRPTAKTGSDRVLRWQSPSNVNWSVQASTDLKTWTNAATISATTTNCSYTLTNQGQPGRFFRVVWP
jgi:endonuclease/exonuclease/phosphatase family metal-dependent hydrolase